MNKDIPYGSSIKFIEKDKFQDKLKSMSGKMKTSEKAKAAGLKNLKELCELTGQSPQTIKNWDKYKPDLFKVVLAGAVSVKSE